MTMDQVHIPANGQTLPGNLEIPTGAQGIVLFAHGSGSSRYSPRNQFVARKLQEGRLATLLIDLLTPEEERVDAVTARLRFDIAFLATRLTDVARWLASDEHTRRLRLGLFGASTGAAAALVAAAALPDDVAAVVSRGGRPDLAGDKLPHVTAPTLLIVGGRDVPVIDLNQRALALLRCDKRLAIVPGATHLFEEPGALDEVACLAREWFECYLAPSEVRLPHGEPMIPGP
jgi:putative phosphoribosyl transferase